MFFFYHCYFPQTFIIIHYSASRRFIGIKLLTSRWILFLFPYPGESDERAERVVREFVPESRQQDLAEEVACAPLELRPLHFQGQEGEPSIGFVSCFGFV